MKFLSAIVLAAAIGQHCPAATLGLNFCDSWENPHVSDGTADGFSGWVDSRATGDSTNGAVQTTPLALGASGVTATWTAANTWAAGEESNNEQALYRLYLDDGQTSTGVGVRVTFAGLSAWMAANGHTGYRLRCYVNNDGSNAFQPITVRDGSTTTSPALQTITPAAKGNGSYPTVGTVGTGESRGYGDSPADLAANTVTLTIPSRSGSTRGTLCAVKITGIGSTTPPAATTLTATGVTDTGAVLNGTVNANGVSTAVTFQYGLTTNYGDTVAAVPANLTGTTATGVSGTLANLASATTYHYRVAAASASGTTYGADRTFTTGNPVFLAGLAAGGGSLNPAFAKNLMNYALQVPFATASIQVTPVAEDAGSTIRVQGTVVASGAASNPINLAAGNTTITVAVTAAGGSFARSYVITVTRLPETYVFNSVASVPITTAAFDATGETAGFMLNFAPAAGTNLTVVNNTGSTAIQGRFANLAQGQTVNLSYGGITYPFVANYYGGTGNDLVLQWGIVRLLPWGSNSNGEYGDNTVTGGPVPGATDMTGVLAGKTVMAIAAGDSHRLVLCSDGNLVTWGYNNRGQLGNNSASSRSLVPVMVNMTGVLAGKSVIAVATGSDHCLALCADGAVAAWGGNMWGQLGDNSNTGRLAPVLVNGAGALSGRRAVALFTGANHNLALCHDGSVVAWGYNGNGELGNGTMTNSNVPVSVDRTGVLAGKTIVALAGGGNHSLALCSDGTLAAWGSNQYGQLGNGSAESSAVPVLVQRSGVLAGRTVAAISAGISHSLALCSDGTLVSWGYNNYGQLGNNSTNNSSVPVIVNGTGVLLNKTILKLNPVGYYSSFVLCSDGTLAAWGFNSWGFGNGSSTGSSVPVEGASASLTPDERLVDIWGLLGLVASPPPPAATTLAASGVTDTTATLNGSVIASGTSATVSFRYGLTNSYGSTANASPATVSGTTPTAVSATLGGLMSGTTYHYQVVARKGGVEIEGEDRTFSTSTMTELRGLTLSAGALTPAFSTNVTSYSATVANSAGSIMATPVANDPGATVKVNNIAVSSGSASPPISLAVGDNTITTVVTAAGGAFTRTYSVTVTRLPATFTFSSGSTVPVMAANFDATGQTAVPVLAYAPTVGTSLMMVKNTGNSLIVGRFANLAQGQPVNVSFNNISYRFVANYFGGTGNDLVLEWGSVRLVAWGKGTAGQLGNGGTVNSTSMIPVEMNGVLAGKTVLAVDLGAAHGLALCADGTIAAWGTCVDGQLGTGNAVSATAPVRVDQSGVLAGKSVVAVAAGNAHSLALCSDGTVAAWGSSASGQLGNGSVVTRVYSPVLVDMTGVLAGSKVIAIAAGGDNCLALCENGTLALWGYYLGSGGSRPVKVDSTGVLAGKTIKKIALGGGHVLVACTDGSIIAWGANAFGQLGNSGAGWSAYAPVLTDRSGVLAGTIPADLGGGGASSIALSTTGLLAGWGYNADGQVGDGSKTQRNTPVAVNQTGVLAGKTVRAVSSADSHHVVLCADGSMASWGLNDSGQLGNSGTTSSSVPVPVSLSGLVAGERVMLVNAGGSGNVALVAMPPRPLVGTVAATAIMDTSATLNGAVNANGRDCSISFEYGRTTAYGSTVAATPATAVGTAVTPVTASLSGLVPGVIYHYRVIATHAAGAAGRATGDDMTFTTTTAAGLAGLALSDATLLPGFDPQTSSYSACVSAATSSVTVTPVVANPAATARVNGVEVTSGDPSGPIALAVGDNTVTVSVAAPGGFSQSFTVKVVRLPAIFTFNTVTDVAVTAEDFLATGHSLSLALNCPLPPGTGLILVRNTGLWPIRGTFGNLTQGQPVWLDYGGVTYPMVADYYGGDGNDLVLRWAGNRMIAWGSNGTGQLGDGTTVPRTSPVPVNTGGVLAGKSIMAVASRMNHSIALCSDGSLAAWGANGSGQLGNGSFSYSPNPVAVNATGVLAGRTVIAVAAGETHSLALCSDGTLASWGSNDQGRLGTGTNIPYSSTPVAVDRSGVLAGKKVVAIACGRGHSLALCEDGILVAWGNNDNGQIGNNSASISGVYTPVLVDRTGVLADRRGVAIAAGNYHSLALCSDGALVAWGKNSEGELGDGGLGTGLVPVLVDRTGVLAGKTVIALCGGGNHSLALCADGFLAAWGSNNYGQLGFGSTSLSSSKPVAVDQTGVLAGRKVAGIAASGGSSLAWCADGTATWWGSNYTTRPAQVDTSGLRSGERVMGVACGTSHNILVIASPPPPGAATLAASDITATSAMLNGLVNAAGGSMTVSFEYGQTASYGTVVAASPSSVTGLASVAITCPISGLGSGNPYHFRVVATGANGTSYGADMTFTPSMPPVFSGYTAATPYQTPASIGLRKLLTKASDPDGGAVSITSAGPASANGGAVALLADAVRYTPPNGFSGTDTFSIVLTDSGGASTTGTVTVQVGPAPNAGTPAANANPPKLTTLPGGKIGLSFQGIPGRSYVVQRSVGGLDDWQTLATVTADAAGKISFTDENPPSGSAFYRLGIP